MIIFRILWLQKSVRGVIIDTNGIATRLQEATQLNEKKTDYEVLYELVEKSLPEFCVGFLINRDNERTLSSRIGYARNLKMFFNYLKENKEFFSDKNIFDVLPADMARVTPQDLDLFINKYAEGKKPATVARMKSSISSMYSYLTNTLQAVTYNPALGVQKIRVPEKDYVVYLNLEEQKRLLNAVVYGTGLTKRELSLHEKYAKRDLAMIFLLLDTGLRAAELRGADNRDINLESCSIIVTRKGGMNSEVYFSDESAKYLKDYLEEKKRRFPTACGPTDPLILSQSGGRLTVRQYENIIPKYVRAALPERYESINCHKLRSSFAMSFYMRDPAQGGHNILALQQRMNHKKLTTTNIYAKAADNVSKQTRNWRDSLL